MKILIIDTSNNKEIKVGLNIDGKEHMMQKIVEARSAQAALPLIEKTLHDNELELKDLTGIQVNPGPGSFTGLRVGIAIANTFAHMLKIPVNGKKIGEIVEPVYQ